MFQFRAFPSYGYLIHRTMTAYCAAVLPHSEISGSTLICSSPKLIAACHVLHRLLMPRHSPCALFSLTCSKESSTSFRPSSSTPDIHSVPLPLSLPSKPACAGLWPDKGNVAFFVWFSIKNYAGSTELLKQNCIYPFVRENCASLRPPFGAHPVRSVSSSSQIQTRLRWALDL